MGGENEVIDGLGEVMTLIPPTVHDSGVSIGLPYQSIGTGSPASGPIQPTTADPFPNKWSG